MIEDKIIQIIPAPAGTKVVWADQDDRSKWFEGPVVCLALINHDIGNEDEHQTVEPMSLDSDGVIDECINVGGFVMITSETDDMSAGVLKNYWKKQDEKEERKRARKQKPPRP